MLDSSSLNTDVSRLVAGCMSGTSLDGIDVALVELSGTGRRVSMNVVHGSARPWPESYRAKLLKLADPSGPDFKTSTEALSALNADLAVVYAESIRSVVEESGRTMNDIDAVGNHGQTLFHDPVAGHTLQLGDPARLAHLLGTTVVGDFRQADMALGGEGAPLVPYMDWAVFTNETEHRLLLNLGGIANITSLPPGAARDAVLAFDTGPANMLIDAMAERLIGKSFDEGGTVAAEGTPDEAVLTQLLEEDYFMRIPPKSTGRELYGKAFVQRLLKMTEHLDTASRMATTAALTVRSIADAVERFIPGEPDTMLVSGGGVHNRAVMDGLSRRLPGVKVGSLAKAGFDPDSKEAVCFALLAHEALNGVPTGMPSVTGASGHAFSGKICPAGTTRGL